MDRLLGIVDPHPGAGCDGKGEKVLRRGHQAHVLQPDGSYEKVDLRGRMKVNSQDQFCEEAKAAVREKLAEQEPKDRRVFVPAEPQEEIQEEQ